MVDRETSSSYLAILRSELIPAFGCTEPIAVAFAAAKAREILGRMPERIEIRCSGNIVKNVKAVTVPNTGGLKGIEAAAIAGVIGGDAGKGLQVLEGLDAVHVTEIKRLCGESYCTSELAEGVENLFIAASVFSGTEHAKVCIKTSHTNIFRIIKNGSVVWEKGESGDEPTGASGDRSLLSIRNIIEFAETVDLDEIGPVIARQILMNSAISDEGLKNRYGAEVGRTLLKCFGTDIKIRAKARAAAGSDARMGGCSLPVVINSGSGNQGMTVSLPVIEYAGELKVSQETLKRALIISNLVAIHQKTLIGRLSAYCGAVSAACGSGAGITWLCGGNYRKISDTIINTIANVGGIVCDGAKASCAAKIAASLDAAMLAHHLSMEGFVFGSGEGLVKNTVEDTIRSIGRMGSIGMKSTDVEILRIMIGTDTMQKEDQPC